MDPAPDADVERLRRHLAISARAIVRELDDIWGHVSCRLPRTAGFLLRNLRPAPGTSGIGPELAFDLDGHPLGPAVDPPSELPIHVAIYRLRPDATCVVHAHPPVATALTAAGRTVFAISQDGYAFGAGLPVVAGDLVIDAQRAERLVVALDGGTACLLAGHGAVVVGGSIPDATVTMIVMERSARQIVWASATGRPQPIPTHIRDEVAARRAGREPDLWRSLEAELG